MTALAWFERMVNKQMQPPHAWTRRELALYRLAVQALHKASKEKPRE